MMPPEVRSRFEELEKRPVNHVARYWSALCDLDLYVPSRAKSLLEYASRYAPDPAPIGYSVRFTPYDWSVADCGRRR